MGSPLGSCNGSPLLFVVLCCLSLLLKTALSKQSFWCIIFYVEYVCRAQTLMETASCLKEERYGSLQVSFHFYLGVSVVCMTPIAVTGAHMKKLLFFGLRNQSKARKLNAGESKIILEEKEAGKGSPTSVHDISD